MEKSPNKNLKEDAVDITKIYEIIRDKGFIQNLWIDVLSDLKNKPSYMKLKKMVENVLETSVENYATKPKDHDEKLRTRTIFTDIGIMTFTIDTLMADVLKKKFKDDIFSMVEKIIDDYNHKRNLSSMDNKANAVVMLEDIAKLLCSKDDEPKEPHDSNGSPGPSKGTKGRLSEKTASNQHRLKKKSSIKKGTSLGMNDSLNMACSNRVDSKSKSPSKWLKYNCKNSAAFSDHESSDVDVTQVSDDENDNNSIRSVSSVHTSDLSSFEDDISISSEDESGYKVKKRVSLKLAKDLYNSGRLSDLHKTDQRTEERVSPGPSVKHSVDSTSQRSSSRMRKPNSKYASDDIVCPMKLNLSQTDSYISDKEILSTDDSERLQASSPNLAMKRQEKSPKKLKSSMNKRNSVQESESSDESENSLPSLENIFKMGKQAAIRRGRPKNDKLLTEETSPAIEQRRGTNAKRGRPSKSIEEPLVNKRQCVLDKMLPKLEKKLKLETGTTQQTTQNVPESNDMNSNPESKRKRGRPSKNDCVEQMADEPIQHSVESFSKFEERLCLKDKCSESSPSKSSKSYDTSDLYKPRSDFRIFNSGRGSKAFTLFSN